MMPSLPTCSESAAPSAVSSKYPFGAPSCGLLLLLEVEMLLLGLEGAEVVCEGDGGLRRVNCCIRPASASGLVRSPVRLVGARGVLVGWVVVCGGGAGINGRQGGREKGGTYWMDTSRLSSSKGDLQLLVVGLAVAGWKKRTWVAWALEGEVGFRKSRLPRLPRPLGEERSTRAPMRGVEEGVSGPHISSGLVGGRVVLVLVGWMEVCL